MGSWEVRFLSVRPLSSKIPASERTRLQWIVAAPSSTEAWRSLTAASTTTLPGKKALTVHVEGKTIFVDGSITKNPAEWDRVVIVEGNATFRYCCVAENRADHEEGGIFVKALTNLGDCQLESKAIDGRERSRKCEGRRHFQQLSPCEQKSESLSMPTGRPS